MSKIIRRTVGTKKEIGAALVLAQTGNSVEFFWPAPNLFRELRPGVSVVGTEKWKCHANETGANFPVLPKVMGENQIAPINSHGLKVISVGFLNPGDKPLIWRGPMLHSIVKQFLGSVQWGQLDYLVIDLPPGTGDVALSLIQTVPLTGAIVVSTPSDVSLQDARKAIEMFRQMKVDIVGMVENMSYFVCPHCQHEIDIFSRGGAEKTAKQFDIAFLGGVELDPEIRKSGDSGSPSVLQGEDSPHAKSLFAFAACRTCASAAS